MKLKVTVLGVVYEVEVDVVDEGRYSPTFAVPMLHAPINMPQASAPASAPAPVSAPARTGGAGKGYFAPVSGVMIEICVKTGDSVKRGTTIAIIEAMKMRTNLVAEEDTTIGNIAAKAGDNVREGQLIVEYV